MSGVTRPQPACAGLLGPSSSNSPLCGQPACVVLLGSRLYANRDHACAANPPTLCSSALRLYATRDHTCAASPPASCSSALRLYATQDILGRPMSWPCWEINGGGDIICAAEEQENKNPRFPKRCSSSCEDWCAKSAKHKTAYRDCVT